MSTLPKTKYNMDPTALSNLPEYRNWSDMKSRCYSPSRKHISHQIKGIKVCERWRSSFSAFLEDMGPRPSKAHTLDRIDNDGDYTPENCKWATRVEQNTNRGDYNRWFTHNGETRTLTEWCAYYNIEIGTLRCRLRGMLFSKAITTKIQTKVILHEYHGKSQSLPKWADELGLPEARLRRRLERGMSLHEAIHTPSRRDKHPK